MDMQNQIQKSGKHGEIEFYIEERCKDYVKSRLPITEGILNPFGVVQAGATV